MEKEQPHGAEKEPYQESLQKFKEALRDWHTSDGEDFCPNCWDIYLQRFTPDQQKTVKEDSSPITEVAETRKASDGWLVMCERSNEYDEQGKQACKNEVFVPY